jgi:hypothetical protein
MAGLQCAARLTDSGVPVVLLDKGSRAGGRMATRPVEGALADYGAQYVEALSHEFRLQLKQWQSAGMARLWGFGFEGESTPSGLARYAIEGGMNRLPAHLGQSLNIRLRTEVERIALDGDHWLVSQTDGPSWRVPALVLTCPVPQALTLIDRGGIPLDRTLARKLDTVLYDPCFTLLLRLAGESRVPCPGALALDGQPLYWIADNRQKGVAGSSSEGTVLTLHAGPEFSTSHFDDDRDRVIRLMEHAAEPYLGAPILARHLHRWRYSRARTPLVERFLTLHESPLLLLAGDACGGRDVESAALSGIAAATALLERRPQWVSLAC